MKKVGHTSPISFWHLLMNFEKPENSEFWKNERTLLEISSFYTCVPKTTIIWGTFPEIQSETNCFLSFWTIFCPLPPAPHNNPENQNFEKMKKATGYSQIWRVTDIIFCQYKAIFCSFTPPLTLIVKIWEKYKKHLEILSFYTCAPQIKIIWCMVPEIWCATGGNTDRRTYRKSDIKRWVPHLKKNDKMKFFKKSHFLKCFQIQSKT